MDKTTLLEVLQALWASLVVVQRHLARGFLDNARHDLATVRGQVAELVEALAYETWPPEDLRATLREWSTALAETARHLASVADVADVDGIKVSLREQVSALEVMLSELRAPAGVRP